MFCECLEWGVSVSPCAIALRFQGSCPKNLCAALESSRSFYGCVAHICVGAVGAFDTVPPVASCMCSRCRPNSPCRPSTCAPPTVHVIERLEPQQRPVSFARMSSLFSQAHAISPFANQCSRTLYFGRSPIVRDSQSSTPSLHSMKVGFASQGVPLSHRRAFCRLQRHLQ